MLFFVLTSLFPLLTSAQSINFEAPQWKDLEFSNIPKNQVEFNKNSLAIQVKSSASPLVHIFTQPAKIKAVKIEAKIIGKVQLKSEKQGSQGNDDFVLKIGLVTQGEKRMGRLKALFAPDWVRELYSMARDGQGIDAIHFYNVYQDKRLAQSDRIHPLSELIHEHMVIPLPADGMIKKTIAVELPQQVLGLWISSDGDDTGSEFSVQIKKIELVAE